MPDRNDQHEPFSNPLPPTEHNTRNEEHSSHHPMTNDDFRKLLMTPRAPPHAAAAAPPVTEEVHSHPPTKKAESETDDEGGETSDDKAERRKRKKKYYASLNKQEEDKLAELAQRYRDRAKERRDGVNPDYQNEDPITSAAGYRAVAPDAKSGLDAAERRRQMIQESKFLGGDMEHTHLVKGLDYALLQKVRSEINYKEKEEEELENLLLKHNIFGDIGDYVPTLEKRGKTKQDKKPDSEKRKSYFEKPRMDDDKRREEKQRERANEWDSILSSEYGENAEDRSKDKLFVSALKGDDSRLKAKLTSKLDRDMPESYAECYPGAPENEDAVADSDDEVDYSKMDMGNKKGPIGRWDFDTPEEYSEYMSNKEALPKAAFQYGVKMADGRKTRRTGTGKRDEKTKLDRELQKINQIIARRKDLDSFSSGVGTPEYKRPRY
ncbi:protein Red [Trichonephila inaurata madagascariensis]|uniref:Protein Red n=1 Tax=Trichonephila inaurata madagascariensis TaxID=2747483 RepID=A0A8X7C5D2_9ARAC|nr:protein Red [Trichonephila inaurata madagascariensis]